MSFSVSTLSVLLAFVTGSDAAITVGNCAATPRVTPSAIKMGYVIPSRNPTNNVTAVGVGKAIKLYEYITNQRLAAQGLPTIETVEYGHTGGPSAAFRRTYQMIEEDPNQELALMFGALTGDDTVAMSYISTFQEIPHLDTGATSGALSDKTKFPYFVRGQQAAPFFGVVWAEAFKAMGIKVAAVLREETVYGDSYERFVGHASTLGIEVRTIVKIPSFQGATLSNGKADMSFYDAAWDDLERAGARFVITFVGTVNLVRTLYAGGRRGLVGRGVENPFVICGLSRDEYANIQRTLSEVVNKGVVLTDTRSTQDRTLSTTAVSWGLPANATLAVVANAAQGNLNMGSKFDYINATVAAEHRAIYRSLNYTDTLSFAGALLCDMFVTIETAIKSVVAAGNGCRLNGMQRQGSVLLKAMTAVSAPGCTGPIKYDENYDRLFLIDIDYVDGDASRNLTVSTSILTFDSYANFTALGLNDTGVTRFYAFKDTNSTWLTEVQVKRVFNTSVTWGNLKNSIPWDGSPPVVPAVIYGGKDDEVPVAAYAVPIAVGVPILFALIAIFFILFFKKEKPRTLEEGDPDDVTLEALAAEAPNYKIHHGIYRGLRCMVQTYVVKHDAKSHREETRSDYMAHNSSGKETSEHRSFSVIKDEDPSKKSSPKVSQTSVSIAQKMSSLFSGSSVPRSKAMSAKLESVADSGTNWSTASNPFETAIRGLYNRLPLVNRMFDVKRNGELLTILRSSQLVMATNMIVTSDKVKLFLREHMQSGNMTELRQNQLFSLDDPEFRMKIILDVCRGIVYLKGITKSIDGSETGRPSLDSSSSNRRDSTLGELSSRRRRSINALPDPRGTGWRDLHGRIFPSNIFFDQGMSAKLGVDMGVPLASPLEVLTFSAPEVVTKSEVSVAADVYSLGILIYDLFATKAIHAEYNQTELVQLLAAGQLRPDINKLPPNTPEMIKDIIVSCTVHNPSMRPDPEMLMRELERAQMQVIADAASKPTAVGKSRLDYGFPPDVKRAILEGRKVEPKPYECVSIFFSDIVSFTTIAAQLGNEKTMDMLDRLYTVMDAIVDDLKLFKAETIGDAFMCVGGLDFPPGGPDHMARVVKFACKAIKAANTVLLDTSKPEMGTVQIRVGINCGNVVASVVGNLNPKYCLFGSTVNIASRMESTSIPGRIQLSEEAKDLLLRDNPALETYLEDRGMIDVKGNGRMHTFFFNHENVDSFLTSAG